MNLFDKVMKGAMARRMGDLTMVTFGSRGGSMMVASMDFQSARGTLWFIPRGLRRRPLRVAGKE